MSEYAGMTEYVVNFGERAGSRFVRLNMALIEQNGARLCDRVVRCGECKHFMAYMAGAYCDHMAHAVASDGFCAWGERRADG